MIADPTKQSATGEEVIATIQRFLDEEWRFLRRVLLAGHAGGIAATLGLAGAFLGAGQSPRLPWQIALLLTVFALGIACSALDLVFRNLRADFGRLSLKVTDDPGGEYLMRVPRYRLLSRLVDRIGHRAMDRQDWRNPGWLMAGSALLLVVGIVFGLAAVWCLAV